MQRAVGASIVVAVALIVSTWLSQKSSQADLRLAVEELRARAGELAVLSRAAEQRRLPDLATEVAAHQLKDKIVDIRKELADLQRDTQSPHATRAVEIANGLATHADAIAAQRHADTSVSRQIGRSLQTLVAMETELRPK